MDIFTKFLESPIIVATVTSLTQFFITGHQSKKSLKKTELYEEQQIKNTVYQNTSKSIIDSSVITTDSLNLIIEKLGSLIQLSPYSEGFIDEVEKIFFTVMSTINNFDKAKLELSIQTSYYNEDSVSYNFLVDLSFLLHKLETTMLNYVSKFTDEFIRPLKVENTPQKVLEVYNNLKTEILLLNDSVSSIEKEMYIKLGKSLRHFNNTKFD